MPQWTAGRTEHDRDMMADSVTGHWIAELEDVFVRVRRSAYGRLGDTAVLRLGHC